MKPGTDIRTLLLDMVTTRPRYRRKPVRYKSQLLKSVAGRMYPGYVCPWFIHMQRQVVNEFDKLVDEKIITFIPWYPLSLGPNYTEEVMAVRD